MGQGRLRIPMRTLLTLGLVLLLAPLLAGGALGLPGFAGATARAAVAAESAGALGSVASAGSAGYFADVPPGSAYGVAIDTLSAAGVIDGYFEQGRWLFKPQNPVMRAQFAKMICGALDIPVAEGAASPFTDMDPNDPTSLYPNDYAAAVAALRITMGTSPGFFSPWDHVTRAQLVTMTVRAANALAPGVLAVPPTGFAGTLGDFDADHAPAMRTAEWNGLPAGLVGFGATWDPWADASRGETAEMLARLMALVETAGGPGGSTTTTTAPGTSSTETTTAHTTTTMPPTGTTTTTLPSTGTTTTTVPGTSSTTVATATTTTTTDSPSTTVPGGPGSQALGIDAAITFRLFPADNPWNTDVSGYPVHPLSSQFIASIGASGPLPPDFGTVWDGAPNGIPYIVVAGDQARVPVNFSYADESDPGPYPIPADAPIEGGPSSSGDRHVIILDATHRMLYELYDAHPAGDHWEAGSGAIFDLTSNALRPEGWTSADAAGLPMLPGLVRYDEVASGEITHALRFTVDETQQAYIHPATHYASSDTNTNLPPMGLRLRLRADYDISGFPAKVQVILRALKKYGMIVADNGSSWYISGAPDPRWSDDELHTLSEVPGSAFEAVYTGPTITP